jgi:hypothetical protein
MTDEIYTRSEIIGQLQRVSLELIKWASEQTDKNFSKSVNGKWSTAQQIDHLTKSIKPLNMILGKPKFIIKILFGIANRNTRSYQTVVDKYNLKLEQGGRATSQFQPKSYSAEVKKKHLGSYASASEKLERKIKRYSENDLDKYILPHPLLGKLTIREMLFFTIYHTRHHHQSLINLYT